MVVFGIAFLRMVCGILSYVDTEYVPWNFLSFVIIYLRPVPLLKSSYMPIPRYSRDDQR